MPNEIPPEEYYRTARKVDWAGITSNHRKIGKEGETLVFNLERHYLRAIGRDDLAQSVQFKEDGEGYDILSYHPDGREKYIEVKTTVKTLDAPYAISRNELQYLADNRGNAFIYRVSMSNQDETVRLRVYTFSEVIHATITPKAFIVTHT